MTKETGNKNSSGSALAKLAELPKIGRAFGYDFSLGFSHRQALFLASDTLEKTPEGREKSLFENLLKIFFLWKDEHGIYPPAQAKSLFDVLDQKEHIPAKEHEKKALIASKPKGQDAKILDPWECCSYVETPVGLFWKLLGDGYVPLVKFLAAKNDYYDEILSILILISNNSNSEYQSADCIEAALKLASYRLKKQEAKIEIMWPDAEAAFNRRKMKKLKEEEKKAETRLKVQSAHQQCLKEGKRFNLKAVADNARVSVPTASRYLRELNIKRYKTK